MESSSQVFVPSVVLGELHYGALKSFRVQENLGRISAISAQNVVLACDAAPSRHHRQFKHGLRLKARPIPENDLWIAAIAQQYGLTLVSRDGHFHEVDDLPIATW